MKSFLLIILLILFRANSYAQPTTLLKGFVQDAVEQKLSNTELGNKYFCTTMLHRTNKYGVEARSYLESTLSDHRINLRTRQVNPDNIVLKAFDKLTKEEIPAKPFHMLSETKNVYVVQYQGKIVMFILLQDDQKKIASTLLINQGDERYFLDFCQ